MQPISMVISLTTWYDKEINHGQPLIENKKNIFLKNQLSFCVYWFIYFWDVYTGIKSIKNLCKNWQTTFANHNSLYSSLTCKEYHKFSTGVYRLQKYGAFFLYFSDKYQLLRLNQTFFFCSSLQFFFTFLQTVFVQRNNHVRKSVKRPPYAFKNKKPL